MPNRFKDYPTLFLDRDGVINDRPVNDYVKTWKEFKFLPGTLNALGILARYFRLIFIITNQQGIGKGLMSASDLDVIHKNMMKEIVKNGGRVDMIYYCPELDSEPFNCRKPGLKMANQAKSDFPEVDFAASLMAGDTPSDMEFGRNAGMTNILINTGNISLNNQLFDHTFKDLISFANAIDAND